MQVFLLILVAVISCGSAQNETSYLPTVIWHGMGDSCCNPLSMGHIIRTIEKELPGIYVYSIRIGNNILEDTEHGFIGNVNEQVADVCTQLSQDPLLQGGYNSLGFSQGAQFLRAVAQRCPIPMVNNLVGIGAQHQGVFGVPGCTEYYTPNTTCEEFREQLSTEAYAQSIQNRIVQAQYWHDSLQEDLYRNVSIFIAEINNENEMNEAYKNNLLSLDNLVMVKFLQDSMVVPRESSWFGFYAPGQDNDVLSLRDTALYKEDRLGLKQLDAAGRLQFISTEGDHLEFSDQWFIDNIVNVYLNTEVL